MDRNNPFFGQVELLVRVLPFVAKQECFALKGGTAINLFVRDLFDMKQLFENEGIDRDLFKTFLVYLISHGRPMSELLSPTRKDISKLFETEFREMTEVQVSLDDLLEVRERLITHIQQSLTDKDRAFLLSVKSREPDWSLLELESVADLPAVQWKLINLNRMKAERHEEAVNRLKTVLEQGK